MEKFFNILDEIRKKNLFRTFGHTKLELLEQFEVFEFEFKIAFFSNFKPFELLKIRGV